MIALLLIVAARAEEQCANFHPTFPPTSVPGVVRGGTGAASKDVAKWFKDNVASLPMPGPPMMTERDRQLAKLSLTEYIAQRKAGEVTCVEYAKALTKRALHYKDMNWFMYWDVVPEQMEMTIDEAASLDQKAQEEGVESLAPLYCLPVPLKGTMASTKYPSSAGSGILNELYAVKDADAVAQLRKMNGVAMGKTNVPEFAASWITCNYRNGCALNPHAMRLTSGGSSGGGGAAVAAYVAPVAFTEDTGGSTRHPSAQNNVYGYDPSRNHYPNGGNPGITYLCDQVGINARSIDDIIAFDAAFLGTAAEHQEAAKTTKPLKKLRVGVPEWPFVEFSRPATSTSILSPAEPARKRVSANIETKLQSTIAALKKAGVTVVAKEWPDDDRDGMNNLKQSMFNTEMGPTFDGLASLIHSFSGQMHEWTKSFLNTSISVKELVDDMYALGSGYAPPSFVEVSSATDESHFRYAVSQWVFDSIDAWNSIFDKYDLDFILVPTLFCDALTYECMGDSSCTMRYSANESDPLHDIGTVIPDCTSVSLFGWKFIPITKIAFPVGKDPLGNPVSMQLLARSGPPKKPKSRTWIFDDAYAKTHDIPILHKAKTITDAVQAADPDLARMDPILVTTGSGNLF